jgi:polyphosphate kinase
MTVSLPLAPPNGSSATADSRPSSVPEARTSMPPSKGPQPGPLDDPQLYVNREMSWLSFNARVIDEALDPYQPLLERLKFLAIHAANLDEFFMIRVSGLHEQLEAAIMETSPDGLSPREQLTRIRVVVDQQVERAYATLTNELLPALGQHGLFIVDFASLDAETQQRANEYFRRSVFPVLTPLAVDPGHPFPFVSNLSISLAVEVRDPGSTQHKFARVKVPECLPRFVSVEGLSTPHSTRAASEASFRYLPLEQLIAVNLGQLFPELEVVSCHPFRVTRDMDIDILAEEADDLMSVIDRELRKRRFGACVRLEVDRRIPERVRNLLREELEIDQEDVYEVSGPLGLSSLFSLATLDRPGLRDTAFTARVPKRLIEGSLFAAIRAGDVLLHHPYDSFTPVLDFLSQAATDPNVLAIKMTLYRAGSNAEAVRTLIRAAENGKQVAVSIELKARFDEENNITWAKTMERAGVHVFYGGAGLKTHAKMCLVVRREGDAVQRYVHLSTGNYNASTARLYTDMGILTADAEIGEDVSELFNALSGFSKQTRYRKLAVAPMGLADAILGHIDEQIREAEAGRPARIFAKLNALVDGSVIRALYRASMANVSIDLVVRGICCLRPGIVGISENIRVRSIVGRFLEHERIFIFGTGDGEKMFASSADWMPRNFYRRVEVLFPIDDPELRAQIRREVVEPALNPYARCFELQSDGTYVRMPVASETSFCMQASILEQIGGDSGRKSQVFPPV